MTIHFSSADTELSDGHFDNCAIQKTSPLQGLFHTAYRSLFKRALDVSLTILVIPVVLPLISFLAFLVAVDGCNPFYSQLRIGKDGKAFRLWKLRTMVCNADCLLEKHLRDDPEARAEWNATQKLKNDPRITWAGRFLRKSSLDELPQLWNVLIGNMSLVGPRPMMPCQKAQYTGQSYYRMLPGITGLWQVSDRNESVFSKRVEYDDVYDRIMCIRTDMNILIQTIRVVMRGTGY